MSSDQQDNQLRELFGELKRTDEKIAPSFETDWKAAGSSKPTAFFAELRYGRLAAAVLILVGLVALVSHERSENRSMALKIKSPPASTIDNGFETAPASLDTWQSPTAFLLREPDEWDQALKSTEGSSTGSPSTQPYPRHST